MGNLQRKLQSIESYWSLLSLIRDHWASLAGFIIAAFGAMRLLWRYIVMIAENVGWWVYPIFFALVLLSASMLWMLAVLALRKQPILPDQLAGTDWATGSEVLSVKDAASALRGYKPRAFNFLAEVQTLASEILREVRSGHIGTIDDMYDHMERDRSTILVSIDMANDPPKFSRKSIATLDTKIWVSSLIERYQGKSDNMNTEWVAK